MNHLELFWDTIVPLISVLPPEDQERISTAYSRIKDSFLRLEAKYNLSIQNRYAVHTLLTKTSEELIQRYQTLFEHSGTAMIVIEDDCTISLVNSLFEKMFGYSREEVENKKSFVDFVTAECKEKLIENHQKRREDDPTVPDYYEIKGLTKGGKELDLAISVGLFQKTRQSVASLIDITGRKTIEREREYYTRELQQQAQALMQANDKLNILNQITRHDINNQLTTIIGYFDLLKDEITDTKILQYLDIQIRAAENIQEQIIFTREYQDIGIQSPRWFDIRSMIEDTAGTLTLSGINLIVHFDDWEMKADPLVTKVFYTLLENGIRHGERVTQIDFSCGEMDTGLTIIYEDNGMGVPGDHKEDIFQKKYFKHTGFGLFLVASILNITGITIRENGVYGRGARFEIMVPKGAYRSRRSLVEIL